MASSLKELDTGWIERGLLKRRSNHSPVVCFETTDPRRLHQLKSYLSWQPEFARYEQVFVYDQWNGLERLIRGDGPPRTEPYRKTAPASPLGQRLREEGVSLHAFKAALKEVDPYLRKGNTIFIIQNVSEHRESESGLESAIKAWAIDQGVVARGSTVFILTADAGRILDEFTRELAVIIEVDPSLASEREAIIESTARELEVPLDDELRFQLVVATAGLNLHQLESILLESYFTTRRFDPMRLKTLKSELVRKSGVLEVSDPRAGFDDIGGYAILKDFVRKYIVNVLRHPERAGRFGVPLPKGILFFGPPGTGKSLFANALASEIGLPFINLVTENIYSKWLGESGQKMKSAIRLAEKMSPAIVFVDEIDRFGRRGVAADSAGEETRRVFSQFLEWLGRPDREAIIVGTTNVPEHLDEAFTRTGRFDYKIPFLYPGPAARLDILKVHLGLGAGTRHRRPPLAMEGDALVTFLARDVVPATGAFSGAELEEVVTRARRLGFDRGAEVIGAEDFLAAVRSFRVDHGHRQRTIAGCLAQARRLTDDQGFLDAIEQEMEVGEED
ncbi:MAG: ATP-binding protein [bacterium]|nr:ATP-binding protein [bacterium]